MTYFPKAKIIADKFHYSRYIVSAVNDVRIETQKKLPPKEKKYFFHSKNSGHNSSARAIPKTALRAYRS